jgi:hypothetical protein
METFQKMNGELLSHLHTIKNKLYEMKEKELNAADYLRVAEARRSGYPAQTRQKLSKQIDTLRDHLFQLVTTGVIDHDDEFDDLDY